MNKCPHPNCQKTKPREVYACKPHWFSLPASILQKIWKGYRSSAELWIEANNEALEFWKGKSHGGQVIAAQIRS